MPDMLQLSQCDPFSIIKKILPVGNFPGKITVDKLIILGEPDPTISADTAFQATPLVEFAGYFRLPLPSVP